jgi:hypothetical protein
VASVFVVMCQDGMDSDRDGPWFAYSTEEKANAKVEQLEAAALASNRKGRSFWYQELDLDEEG